MISFPRTRLERADEATTPEAAVEVVAAEEVVATQIAELAGMAVSANEVVTNEVVGTLVRSLDGTETCQTSGITTCTRVAEEVVIEVPEQAPPNFLSATWTLAFPMRTCGNFSLNSVL